MHVPFDRILCYIPVLLQAVPEFVEACSQTDWKYPRNNCTQYEAREFTQEQKDEIMKKPELKVFAEKVVPRYT